MVEERVAAGAAPLSESPAARWSSRGARDDGEGVCLVDPQVCQLLEQLHQSTLRSACCWSSSTRGPLGLPAAGAAPLEDPQVGQLLEQLH